LLRNPLKPCTGENFKGINLKPWKAKANAKANANAKALHSHGSFRFF
jgi:hypothetical protein